MPDKQNESLKPGWRRVKFGDVVRQCKEKADPDTSGLERYIAGEHMDTDDLRLRRWGEIGSGYLGPAFQIRFKPGQVLYGSRRTYLRKLAVADFEGICANTTFVMESKNSADLLPEFLPFLMQTDAFNAFSIENSKGSVNPYINFTDLERFEFALPPIEAQRRAINALLALDEVANSTSNLVADCNSLYLASLDQLLGLTGLPPRALQNNGAESVYPVLTLQDVVDQRRPISYGILQPGKGVINGVPMLRTMDFDELGRREATEIFRVAESVENTSASTRLQGGELLISVMATIGRTFVVPDSMVGYNVNRALAVIAPDLRNVSSEYLEAFFHSRYARQTLEADKIGSAQHRINLEQLRKMRLPVPPMPEQRDIVALSSALKRSVADTEARSSSFKKLREQFLREIFD